VALPAVPENLAKTIPKDELEKLVPNSFQPQSITPGAQAGNFQSVLGEMINEVSAKQSAAGEAMRGVMSGAGVPLHQAMIAAEEASVSFQLMVEVRNRLLESYQELMRMQV
jgi:flagellar hook-basal body complex protein FliE